MSMTESMAYIRRQYGVKAEVGGRVIYTGNRMLQLGAVASVEGARLRILLDGQAHAGLYHPTWEVEYLEDRPFADDVCPTCPSRAISA